MARPTVDDISSGTASWDALINQNKDKLVGAPFPGLAETSSANLNTNFPPALYDACTAVVWDGTPGNPVQIYASDGSAWVLVADSISTGLLSTNNLMYIEDQQANGVAGPASAAAAASRRLCLRAWRAP